MPNSLHNCFYRGSLSYAMWKTVCATELFWFGSVNWLSLSCIIIYWSLAVSEKRDKALGNVVADWVGLLLYLSIPIQRQLAFAAAWEILTADWWSSKFWRAISVYNKSSHPYTYTMCARILITLTLTLCVLDGCGGQIFQYFLVNSNEGTTKVIDTVKLPTCTHVDQKDNVTLRGGVKVNAIS